MSVNPVEVLKRVIVKVTGITRVQVEGNSMEPTFHDGEQIWVRCLREHPSQEHAMQLRGRVILVEREEYPGIYLLKRLEKVHGDGIWIEGDNKDPNLAALQHDSRKFGWLSRETIRGLVLREAKRINA